MTHGDADTIRGAYEVWNESGPAAVTERFWTEDAVYREGPAALARMQALIDLVRALEAVGLSE